MGSSTWGLAILPSFAIACSGARPPEPEYFDDSQNEAVVTDATPEDIAAPMGTQGDVNQEQPMPATPGTSARIETSMGTILIQLNQQNAPVSVANFLQYARAGFYDRTIFHRVIDGFMIQGGGFEHGMVRKQTREPIVLEVSPQLTHVDGAVSMARTGDPNSATAQFFICDGPQRGLDGQYAVFGVVTEGIDVVRAISATPTGPGDVPRADVVILSVRVE